MNNKIGNTRYKAPPVSLELIGVLEHRKSEFARKFGRFPEPGEPLFFDPDAAEPRRMPRDAVKRACADVVALTGLSAKAAADLIRRW